MSKEGIFQDLPMEERKEMLRANAYEVKTGETYAKPLSTDEVEKYKETLVKTTIAIAKDKADLKEVSKGYKDRIKENETMRNEAAEAVQFGAVSVTGEVYLMQDDASGMMEIYSEDGMLINKRPLLPNERQMSIVHQAYKNGTEN